MDFVNYSRALLELIYSSVVTKVHQILAGTDSALSLQGHREETATVAKAINQNTIGYAFPTDSIVLHHSLVEVTLNWMQEHLDACYLQLANIIIEQCIKPG
jgi:hypothetical protein